MLWQDLRLPAIESNPNIDLSNLFSPLREANSWQVTPQGKVRLLARYPSASRWDKALDCAKLTTQ